MIDLLNALVNEFNCAAIASNRGGVFSEDTARLKKEVSIREVFFLTRNRIDRSMMAWPTFLRRLFVLSLVLFEPLFFALNVLLLIRLLKEEKPTLVVSCNGGYPASQACLALVVAAKYLSIPVSLSVVSTPTPRRSYLYFYEKLVDNLVWRSMSVVIVNAKSIVDDLKQFRGMPEGVAQVIYNGIENTSFVSPAKSKREFVIGCVARLDAAKGCLVLLDAFNELTKEYSDIKLVLAGEGDSSDLMRQRVSELGLDDNVDLLGHYTRDVGSLLASFDIFVFPSFWEGFPYSIIESMRAGCVIVATKVGGIPEAITDGQEGVLIEPRSAQDIVNAVKKLRENSDLRETLSRNARRKFEEELSLDSMHTQVRELLCGLST